VALAVYALPVGKGKQQAAELVALEAGKLLEAA